MKHEEQIAAISAHLEEPIVIIGMMGAGKTTLARKLSAALDWAFCDSDLEIEKDTGLSVKEIFETEGEASFREKEKAKVADLLNRSQIVISVGGGAITRPETAEAIFSRSLCLWVNAPIDVLVKRTSHQGSRPLLNGRDPAEALTERMEQRLHLYERAHLEIDGALSPDKVTDNAIGQIGQFLLQKRNEI